jgi:non-ribosomal peptide synthetase component F
VYWKQQLANMPPALKLPVDRPRSSTRSFQGTDHAFVLTAPVADALKALARREGATLFMTLLAAFKVLLAYYADQDDIAVGTPVANRNQPETEDLIGFFVNTLVLRTSLSGDPAFPELVGRVRETALDSYAHQDVPFELLLEHIQPDRNLNHQSLFQVWFVVFSGSAPELSVGAAGVDWEQYPLAVDTGMVRHDLKLALAETPEGLSGSFEYATDLFDPPTIARMAAQYEMLLRTIAGQPDQRLSELRAALTGAARQFQAKVAKQLEEANLQKLRMSRRQATPAPSKKELL